MFYGLICLSYLILKKREFPCFICFGEPRPEILYLAQIFAGQDSSGFLQVLVLDQGQQVFLALGELLDVFIRGGYELLRLDRVVHAEDRVQLAETVVFLERLGVSLVPEGFLYQGLGRGVVLLLHCGVYLLFELAVLCGIQVLIDKVTGHRQHHQRQNYDQRSLALFLRRLSLGFRRDRSHFFGCIDFRLRHFFDCLGGRSRSLFNCFYDRFFRCFCSLNYRLNSFFDSLDCLFGGCFFCLRHFFDCLRDHSCVFHGLDHLFGSLFNCFNDSFFHCFN